MEIKISNETLKRAGIIVAVIAAILCWSLIAIWLGAKLYKQEADKKQKEAEKHIYNVETQLAIAEEQLLFLQEKQQKTKELVESTSTVINELQTSISTSGNTIKALKEQQAKIKSAVIALIEDYERIVKQIADDSATDFGG